MARGFAVPFRAWQGRAVLSKGDAKNADDLALALSEGDSDNPFADDTGIDAPIFALDGRGTRALVGQRIRDRFRRFRKDDRMELVDLSFEAGPDASGDLVCRVQYVDLETDEELEATRTITRGGGA